MPFGCFSLPLTCTRPTAPDNSRGRDARVTTQTTTQRPRCHSGRETRSGNCPVWPHRRAWAPTLGAVLTSKFLLLMVQFHQFAAGRGQDEITSKKVNERKWDISPSTEQRIAFLGSCLPGADSVTVIMRNDHCAGLRSRFACIVACTSSNPVKTSVQISSCA